MNTLKKITALIMSLVIFCTMATPVFATSDEPQTRAEYVEMLSDEGYPAITTTEVAEKMKACSDFFRLMTNGKFPSEERLDISFDKTLTEANLYVVKNCGVDMESILESLPPLNTVSSLIVDTFEIDTKALREALYEERFRHDEEGTGLGVVYYFLGCYLSVIEKIEVYAKPSDNPDLYEVSFDIIYRDGGFDTLNTGMLIDTKTGTLTGKDGKGMLGLGFDFSFKDMVIYTVVNAWTRDFGFMVMYDVIANVVGIYDYVTRRYHFDYDGLEWMIQVWKGTYFYVTNGAEVGIYNRVPGEETGTYYNCATDEQMMEMSMTLSHNGKKLFSMAPQEHWWLTGFHLSGTVYEPESLTMEYSMVFPNMEMLNAFTNSVDNEKNHDAKYTVDGTKISVVW